MDSIKPVFMLAEDEDNPELLKKAFDMNYGWKLHHIMNDIAKGKKMQMISGTILHGMIPFILQDHTVCTLHQIMMKIHGMEQLAREWAMQVMH